MGASWQPDKDMPNLEGRVAVVTGANAGVGLHTAKHLALHGAKVYFTARTESKAQHVRDIILGADPRVPSERLVWLKMDLLDVQSIVEAVADLRSKETKLDILINNAAYIASKVERTKAGWEIGVAVNHFGPYILTMALLPLLKATAAEPGSDVRIINTNTNAHHMFIPSNYPLQLDSSVLWSGELPYDPIAWRYFGRLLFKNNMVHYGLSKLTLAMVTRHLQHLLDEAGVPIICVSPHPGGVASPGLYDLVTPAFLPIVRLTFLSEDQGSWHQLFAATDEMVRREADRFRGSYCEKMGTPHPGHVLLRDAEACRQVWENTVREVDGCLKELGLEPLSGL